MTDFTTFKKGLRETRDAFNSGYAKDTRVSMPGSDWAALFHGIAILVEEVESLRHRIATAAGAAGAANRDIELIKKDLAAKAKQAAKAAEQRFDATLEVVSLDVATKRLSLGISSVKRLIEEGRLECYREGREYRISARSINYYIRCKLTEAQMTVES